MPIITIFLPTGYFSLSFDFRMPNLPQCLKFVDASDAAASVQPSRRNIDRLQCELPHRDQRAENQKWIDCHFERVAALFLRANQKRVSGLFTLICGVCLCIHDATFERHLTGCDDNGHQISASLSRTGVSRLHRNGRRRFEFADPNAGNFAECELRHFVFNDASSRAGRIFSASCSKRGSSWSGLSNGSKRIVFMSGWRLAKDFSNQSIAWFLSPSPR